MLNVNKLLGVSSRLKWYSTVVDIYATFNVEINPQYNVPILKNKQKKQ